MKKYRVTVVIRKEVTRIVYAKNDRQAEALVKRKVAEQPIKISTRNFEEFPYTFEIY